MTVGIRRRHVILMVIHVPFNLQASRATNVGLRQLEVIAWDSQAVTREIRSYHNLYTKGTYTKGSSESTFRSPSLE